MVKRLKNDAQKYWDLVKKHPTIRDALDNLLHIACIWPDMKLSTIHKAFAMKCDELIVNYLQHIKSVLEYVLNYDSGLFKSMNYDSMRMLELTCPKASASDAENLSELQQDLVKRRALEVDTLIPSFRSLFDDINYLELLVNTIKKLHRPKKVDSSLRESLDYIHGSQNADRAWEELFLYVMRNYYRIHAPPTRDTVLKSGDPINLEGEMSEADEAQLNHFAMYASALGFRHCAERRTHNSLPERTGARRGYDAEEKGDPTLVTYGRYTGVKKKRRSGLPRKEFHREYWEFLWLDNMQAANDATGDGITNFFVRKAVYRAFFDPWKPRSTDTADTTSDQSDCDQSLARSFGFSNTDKLHVYIDELFDPNNAESDNAECRRPTKECQTEESFGESTESIGFEGSQTECQNVNVPSITKDLMYSPEWRDASQAPEEHSLSLMGHGSIIKRKSSFDDRGDIPTHALLMQRNQMHAEPADTNTSAGRAFHPTSEEYQVNTRPPKRQKSCLVDMVSRASSLSFTSLHNAIYGRSERQERKQK